MIIEHIIAEHNSKETITLCNHIVVKDMQRTVLIDEGYEHEVDTIIYCMVCDTQFVLLFGVG